MATSARMRCAVWRFAGRPCVAAVPRGTAGAAARPLASFPSQSSRMAGLRLQVRTASTAGGAEQPAAGAEAAVDEAGSAALTQTAAGGLKGSPPLLFKEEVCVYESPVDMGEVAEQAVATSRLAGSVGLLGFAGVLYGLQTAPMLVQALVCAGALQWTYKSIAGVQRTLAVLATRHVSSITILPTSPGEGEPRTVSEDVDLAKDQLDATPELRLQVRTANLDMHLKLSNPAPSWEGGKYTGFVDDERLSFEQLCQRGDILYLDQMSGWGRPGAPSSSDVALLTALTSSPKVIAGRRLELRDASGPLQATEDVLKHVDAQFTQKEGKSKASPVTPAESLRLVGKQAIFSNLMLLTIGGLFAAKAAKAGADPGRLL
eukprot:TRINITY_DN35764_c0_g1_i1.p1 TRINITY_DN35764_c0_g1~~TRINITY_DN35764_c0_g1_i1.p1  ORF type:complete len:397 (-),score=99.37 TRINITY_DN35764_c0_g1_i1:430-1551(-)